MGVSTKCQIFSSISTKSCQPFFNKYFSQVILSVSVPHVLDIDLNIMQVVLCYVLFMDKVLKNVM